LFLFCASNAATHAALFFNASYKSNIMNRDGATTSLWQHDMPPYASKSTAVPNEVADVLIVGGGITGITTALLLQQGGQRCVVAEAHTLCFGTTGGTTSHINSFFDTDYHTIRNDFGVEGAQLVARATRQAIDLFAQHVTTYNIDCGYAERDAYVYAQTDEQVDQLNKIMQASLEAGANVAYADTIPIPTDFQKAIVYPRNAQIHPTKYVYALAQEFEQLGGIILQNCLVGAVSGDELMLEAETSMGTIKAKYVIYATHIPPGGINLLHFRAHPYRSYAMAVTLANEGQYPEALAYNMYDPYYYYRTQEVAGKRYLIVGGEDHKTAHEENTEACFDRLEAHVRRHYDVAEIAFKWSSQYFEPSDGLAYIGLNPGTHDNILVASGFSGNGITYSHIAAITLSQMILNHNSEYARLFNPRRVKPIAGFTEFVKENVDVVKEFFSKRFSQQQLSELAGLAPGDAQVVKWEGESIALYKDERGKLYAVDPICPHAKCAVGWNRAEKSWDCPCHGSRFAPDGTLLTGPARKGLEPIDLEKLLEENK
jgi:glycine/D-amino acid oxidase-like deaminating enzyme/nitrite reductase/ring-hydroxylating ferredoxin subunit